MKNHRQIIVSTIYRRNKKVPYIRLSGHWLAECGFQMGQKIHVYVKPGNLNLNLILPEVDEK